MIEKTARDIALFLKNKFPDEMPSAAIIEYVMKFIIQNVLPLVIIIFFSLIIDKFRETIIFLLGFVTLRVVTGGFHFRSREVCFISSVVFILIVLQIPTISNLNIYLNFISFVIIAIFAPQNVVSRVNKEKHYIFKVLALILVVLSYFINDNIFSFSLFIQSLFIPLGKVSGKGGEK